MKPHCISIMYFPFCNECTFFGQCIQCTTKLNMVVERGSLMAFIMKHQ